ncbi:MAG: AAA family ATPase, partial [Lentisphaerae bacterium]|nr:AAA family ATPase [Lentisphaerota bacterium]
MSFKQIAQVDLELNDKFEQALHLLENTTTNVFVTGRAGTGKSTLLDYFRSNTGKKVVVLAPTGVAALNVRGQTIHSFFRFGTDITYEKVTKKFSISPHSVFNQMDMLIIDEISMVRADLLDCIDKAMRLYTQNRGPFGGKQVAFFGDLFQLSPVVKESERAAFSDKYETSFFYSASVMANASMEVVELENIYRQHDANCIEILNGVRDNSITDEQLKELNGRYDPDFVPDPDDFFVTLTSRNNTVKAIDEHYLKQLPGEQYSFPATITGELTRADMPADDMLVLKEGAQVMFLNNDSHGQWVNGSMGVVTDIDPDGEFVSVRTTEGDLVDVSAYKWKLNKYVYNKNSKAIETEPIGSFEQIPLRLAWAVTIHKSQGKTFPKLIVDVTGVFAEGQVYVA